MKLWNIFGYNSATLYSKQPFTQVYNYFFSSKLCKEKLKLFESVNEEEFLIFERCSNSGLICLNLDYKNIQTDCYGYDFSRYYTNLLLDIKIPMCPGIKKK